MPKTIPQTTLVVVCYLCCGDPELRLRCKRCAGTGADPNPGRAKVNVLNADARAALRDAGVCYAAWARANYSTDGRWHGDVCGCPDCRCIGYHHFAADDCRCLRVLLAEYLNGEGFFADTRPQGGGTS